MISTVSMAVYLELIRIPAPLGTPDLEIFIEEVTNNSPLYQISAEHEHEGCELRNQAFNCESCSCGPCRCLFSFSITSVFCRVDGGAATGVAAVH